MSILQTSDRGPVRVLTLNRPDRRNALNAELVDRLTLGLETAGADQALRLVVVTGAGTAFSSGADLDALGRLQSASVGENRVDSETLARLFRTMLTLPLPILGAVNGHAVGGGCGLAAACDIVFAVPEARLGFPEVSLGFVPALVAGLLRRRVGDAQARLLLFTGRLLDTGQAARIGLVTEQVGSDDLIARAVDFGEELARRTSRSAVAATKALLERQAGLAPLDALADGAAVNAWARGTADCRAGVAAFLAGDNPPWGSAHNP